MRMGEGGWGCEGVCESVRESQDENESDGGENGGGESAVTMKVTVRVSVGVRVRITSFEFQLLTVSSHDPLRHGRFVNNESGCGHRTTNAGQPTATSDG